MNILKKLIFIDNTNILLFIIITIILLTNYNKILFLLNFINTLYLYSICNKYNYNFHEYLYSLNNNNTTIKYDLYKIGNTDIFYFYKIILQKISEKYPIYCIKTIDCWIDKKWVNRLYYTLQNIKKLKNGKIKIYKLKNQLELELLCDFCKKNNILCRIELKQHNGKSDRTIYSFTYDYYCKLLNEKKIIFTNFKNYIDSYNGCNEIKNIHPENKKILYFSCAKYITYSFAIKIYKGYYDLDKTDNIQCENNKLGIYTNKFTNTNIKL